MVQSTLFMLLITYMHNLAMNFGTYVMRMGKSFIMMNWIK